MKEKRVFHVRQRKACYSERLVGGAPADTADGLECQEPQEGLSEESGESGEVGRITQTDSEVEVGGGKGGLIRSIQRVEAC